jgi:hypothetical protein
LRIRADPQISPQRVAQALKLPHRFATIAGLDVRAHQRAVRFLIGAVDLKHLLPHPAQLEQLEIAKPRTLSRLLGPDGVAIFGK